MRDFKRKKGMHKFMESKLVLFLLGGIIILFAWNVFSFIGKMRDTARNKNIAEKKVIELKQMKQELSDNIASLNTEKGQEESIRDKFGFAKEGEEVIVIVEEKDEHNIEEQEDDGKFMNFLKNWFK